MGYGGRQEIVDACREVVTELAEQGIPQGRWRLVSTPAASPPTCTAPTSPRWTW